MVLPVNVDTCTVTGGFVYADGSIPTGTVEFTPVPCQILDARRRRRRRSWPPRSSPPSTVRRDRVELPATDDADLNPVDWTYHVRVRLNGTGPGVAYSFDMAAPTGAVDLTEVTPVDSSNGTAIVVGPPGPPGADGAPGQGVTGRWWNRRSARQTIRRRLRLGLDTGVGARCHASTHAAGSTDPVTITESQVTGLTAAPRRQTTVGRRPDCHRRPRPRLRRRHPTQGRHVGRLDPHRVQDRPRLDQGRRRLGERHQHVRRRQTRLHRPADGARLEGRPVVVRRRRHRPGARQGLGHRLRRRMGRPDRRWRHRVRRRLGRHRPRLRWRHRRFLAGRRHLGAAARCRRGVEHVDVLVQHDDDGAADRQPAPPELDDVLGGDTDVDSVGDRRRARRDDRSGPHPRRPLRSTSRTATTPPTG